MQSSCMIRLRCIQKGGRTAVLPPFLINIYAMYAALLQIQCQVSILDPAPFTQGEGEQPAEYRRYHKGYYNQS